MKFRIFKAHSVAKGPRVLTTIIAAPRDLATALRHAARPVTEDERNLADKLRPTEVK
jgi:hypothetical protein